MVLAGRRAATRRSALLDLRLTSCGADTRPSVGLPPEVVAQLGDQLGAEDEPQRAVQRRARDFAAADGPAQLRGADVQPLGAQGVQRVSKAHDDPPQNKEDGNY